MKAILIVSVVLYFSLSPSCRSIESKIVREKVKTNQYVNQNGRLLKNGLWIEILKDSTIQITNYDYGLKQGFTKTIYKNGEIVISRYKSNLKNGWTKYYNSGGFLYSEILYENDSALKKKNITPPF